MNKYLRTTRGCIFKVVDDFIISGDQELYYPHFKDKYDILADTIEELIQDNDMLYIHDLYPDTVLVVEGDIKPFGYNKSIKLKEWLKYEFTEFDLYIKQPNGDYRKIVEKKQYEGLKLIWAKN